MKDEDLYLIQDDTEYLEPMPKLTDEEQKKLNEVSEQFRQKIKEKYGL